MQIQEIFLAAIDVEDLQQRADYVAQACGVDQELHRKVNALLAAHEKSGKFLDVPALQQIADGNPQDRQAGDNQSLRDEIDLSFLTPSSKPGSLGRLLHYEVLEIVGRGGCGIVLKAFDEKLHRVVAIKMMTPELAVTSPARKRFLREARTTAAIRHENVVSIYAVEEKPFPFLVMEFIDGQTLQDKINETGPLDIQDVLSIGRQIARGLEAAHALGLIHRDIKPANILIENGSGRPKITDFGLARSTDDASLTQSGAISGTPLYMSPEQAQGLEVDHRSDLFSLGSVLYVMCSGRPPFRAATAVAVLKRVVEEQPRPIREIIPETPQWLLSVIAKLHAKKPQGRFSSIHEVLEALEHQESKTAATRMVPRISPSKSASLFTGRLIRWLTWPKRRLWAIPSVVIVALLIGLGLWNQTGSVTLPPTSRESRLPDGNSPSAISAEAVSVPTFSSSSTSNRNSGLQPVTSNGADDPIVGTWSMLMGPWPYTAKFQANGTGEGRFHPDVLKAIKNKNKGSGPPETFPMSWEKIEAKTYSITMLGVTSRDFILNGDRLTCPRWEHPGERLSRSTLPADPDRKAAEYVLSIGGKVQVNGITNEIVSLRDLPTAPFHLTSVNLLQNKKTTEAGFKAFTGTTHIQSLELSAASHVNATTLQCFQENRGLTDLGLAYQKIDNNSLNAIQDFKDLRVLWLNDTQVTDDGLAIVARLPKLRLLGLIRCRISDRGLTHLIGHPSLVHVDLRETPVSDAAFQVAMTWPELGILEFESPTISDRGLADIKDFRKLYHLRLDKSSVTDAGLQLLAKNKGLRYLTLTQTNVTAKGIDAFSKQLPNCEIHWNGGVWKGGKAQHVYDADRQAAQYVLSQGGIIRIQGSDLDIRSGDLLPKSPFALSSVSLTGRKAVSDEQLRIFADCKHIIALWLMQTSVSDQGLAHFQQCRDLKAIDVSGTKVTGPGLKYLAECKYLEHVSLWFTRISLEDFLPLADKPFKHLNFGGNTAFSDKWLSHFTHLESLELLNLRYTDVSDQGLLPLQQCRKLKYLSLGKTNVTDAGLAHLRECTELEDLLLSETSLTDAGVDMLKSFQKLKKLELEKTKVTGAGIEELKRSLSQCRITWDGGVIEPGKP